MSTATQTTLQNLPALEEMGIQNAHEIASYTLRSTAADKDVLKIRYQRAKGSLLPHSRTYRFGRSLRAVIADGGTSRMEHTYEISAFLLKAIAELDTLVADNKKVKSGVKSKIGEERRGDLLAEFNELETLVSQNVAMTDAATVSARFARLKAQIAVL
ncbi:DUF3461 family protein [Granulosicoccus sp.]|nr:DUF3461 family protein [Granulosicoccus sp.]